MAIPEHLKRNYFKAITLKKINGTNFSGNSPPSVFVSHFGYPKVQISPVAPSEILPNSSFLDFPEQWFGFSQEEIISFRQQLVHSTKLISIDEAKNPGNDLMKMQEIVMAEKPVTLEVDLFKRPSSEFVFSNFHAPVGLFAPMKKFELTENPKIQAKIDYLVSDTDVLAEQAISELYASGIPVSGIYKILSTGALGIEKNRKLIPTRWSITATDDTVSKQLIERVKDFQQLSEIQLFQSHYLDNHYFILLIPGSWSFEMLECWNPSSETLPEQISADFEFFNGRKDYASEITGAYYSARLAVTEFLVKEKLQATVLVLREIGPEYDTPLGVWQIRENARHAMQQKPMTFFDLELALKFISSKTRAGIEKYRKRSKLLDFIKNQRKLSEWN